MLTAAVWHSSESLVDSTAQTDPREWLPARVPARSGTRVRLEGVLHPHSLAYHYVCSFATGAMRSGPRRATRGSPLR